MCKVIEMKNNDVGYIVPWGVYILKNNEVYINSEYTVNKYDYEHGTSCMKITKDNDKYSIFLPTKNKYKWSKCYNPEYTSKYIPLSVSKIYSYDKNKGYTIHKTIPETYLSKTIGELDNGDEGYTQPWGAYIDYDRNIYLNSEYTLNVHGTLKVTKINDNYYIYVSKNIKYDRNNYSTYLGKFIPIKAKAYVKENGKYILHDKMPFNNIY